MDSSLRALLDKHIIAVQAMLFRNISGGSFELMPNWGRGYSGLSLPIFNIFMPRTPAGLTDDTLADTAAFFFSRDSLYAIELIHDRLPEGPDFLHRRRYQALPPQPAMVLGHLPEDLRLNPGVKIERVTTVSSLAAFCSLQHDVFDFALHEMLKRFPVVQFREDRIRHYIAFLNNLPVAAGTTVCINGVTSIWNMCTLDAHRRCGVGTTLLYQMLVEAIEVDCKLAVLYSTAQAYNFFSDFGFEIFTQRQWFLPQNIEYADEDDK